MTMLTTVIWGAQTRVQNMHALYLVDHRSIRIQEGEELVENQLKLVAVVESPFNFTSLRFWPTSQWTQYSNRKKKTEENVKACSRLAKPVKENYAILTQQACEIASASCSSHSAIGGAYCSKPSAGGFDGDNFFRNSESSKSSASVAARKPSSISVSDRHLIFLLCDSDPQVNRPRSQEEN